jgi:uracil-DNA glycosylase
VSEQAPVRLAASWMARVGPEFSKPYMQALKQFLEAERQAGRPFYPRGSQIFRALDETPFEAVKVVILGQDPYHGPGQAHGLSFSVPEDVPPPPSLQNIYKEIQQSLGLPLPASGNLQGWAGQGVLLLNAVLTVASGQAGSHRSKGWETFTDRIIALLNDERDHLVFLLWGSYARNKGRFIDRGRHLVLEAPHPSPLSAYRGFLGCNHFKKANEYLAANGLSTIDWRVD